MSFSILPRAQAFFVLNPIFFASSHKLYRMTTYSPSFSAPIKHTLYTILTALNAIPAYVAPSIPMTGKQFPTLPRLKDASNSSTANCSQPPIPMEKSIPL